MNWIQTISRLQESATSHVLVTILETSGSTPREAGTRMIVLASEIQGTIGGGTLEMRVMNRAREMLSEGISSPELMRVPLGASIGQCCGGEVRLFLEPWISRAPAVAVFGAGHVGLELVDVLKNSGIRIHWIDSREDVFPGEIPEGVKPIFNEFPEEEIELLPEGSLAVILTHSHALDQKLCEKLLKWGKFSFLGLIGSATKYKRFQTKLIQKGFSAEQVDRIECPVGIKEVGSKLPRHIAISIAARILQVGRELGTLEG